MNSHVVGFLACVAVGLILSSCADPKPADSPGFVVAVSEQTSTTTLAPTEESTTTVPALPPKAPLSGLIDRTTIPADELGGMITGFVIDVPWADLQVVRNGAIAANNAIDAAIREARAFTERTGHSVGVKLRVRAGIDAPEWAKHLGGSPILVSDAQDGVSGTIGAFWTNAFGEAYEDLQRRLAERYDETPEVLEVVISRCTTVYAEPFLRNIKDAGSVEGMLDRGFDTDQDLTCLFDQIDAHAVWAITHSSLAMNPYQAISASGEASIDPGVTSRTMDYCRLVLGDRCVLGNNSIRWPALEGRMEAMYAEIASFGAPITYQTAAPARVGDLGETIRWATEQGACSVELPIGYQTELTSEQLASASMALVDNNGCA